MNNPGIDLAIWERLRKRWAELETAGNKLKIDFHLLTDVDDEIIIETVQRKAREAYTTLGIAGLSMERLVEVYNEMMHQLYRQTKQKNADLIVTMSPSSPTTGETRGFMEKPNSDIKNSVLVNYQHYYMLNALREKRIELAGDSWSKVRAVYRSGDLEFYFEY